MAVQSRTSAGSDLMRLQETTNAEVSAPARVDCAASSADPISVFSAPRTQQTLNQSLTDSVELFKVKCGDRITVLGDDKQSWLEMRTANGQAAHISSAMVHVLLSAERKREEIQRAADDLGMQGSCTERI
jgi:hypothetical protein